MTRELPGLDRVRYVRTTRLIMIGIVVTYIAVVFTTVCLAQEFGYSPTHVCRFCALMLCATGIGIIMTVILRYDKSQPRQCPRSSSSEGAGAVEHGQPELQLPQEIGFH